MAGPTTKFSLWTAPAKLKTPYKLSLFFLLLFAYLICSPWLLTQLGSVARIFVFIFTLPAAFFWGLKGGVAVSLVTPVLVLALHSLMGVPFSGGVIGPLFLLLINMIVGRMCDLSLRLEMELEKKDRAEMELQQHKSHLEERIRERTAELTRTNRELQQEIGERRQVANALRESEEKYRLLVETANEAIFIAQDGVVKFPNPKTIEMTGYSESEVKAMPFVNLIHPDDREMVAERHLYLPVYEAPIGNTREVTQRVARLADRADFEAELAREMSIQGKYAGDGVIIDVPEPITFEAELSIGAEAGYIGFPDSGTVFDRATVDGFAKSLRKFRVFVDPARMDSASDYQGMVEAVIRE